MLVRSVLTLAVCQLLVCGASAQQVPVDGDFQIHTVGIRSVGDIILIVGSKPINGRIAVCGLAYPEGRNNTTKSLLRQVVDRFYFKIKGNSLDVNTVKFTLAKSEMEAQNSLAGCSVTNAKWPQNLGPDDLEVRANFRQPIRSY